MMTRPIFGVFTMHTSAEAAIDELSENGFMQEDITVGMPSNIREQEFPRNQSLDEQMNASVNPAPTSGRMRGIAARLAEADVMTNPGQTLIATGPLASTLVGQGTASADVPPEGAMPDLDNNTVPDPDNPDYGELVQGENYIVGVLPADEQLAEVAKRVLKQSGAIQVIHGRPVGG